METLVFIIMIALVILWIVIAIGGTKTILEKEKEKKQNRQKEKDIRKRVNEIIEKNHKMVKVIIECVFDLGGNYQETIDKICNDLLNLDDFASNIPSDELSASSFKEQIKSYVIDNLKLYIIKHPINNNAYKDKDAHNFHIRDVCV